MTPDRAPPVFLVVANMSSRFRSWSDYNLLVFHTRH